MKANEIFNFKRFGKYFASDIRTCTRNYGISLLAISLLSLATTYFISIALNLIGDKEWQGPGIEIRSIVFIAAIMLIVITMPAKCYGKLTDKQYGSLWLMLPASRLEKFISMVIMTVTVFPLAGMILYLGLDTLICAIDPTCGNNIIAGVAGIRLDLIHNELQAELLAEGMSQQSVEAVSQLTNPLMYIGEFAGTILPFLLGAIFFRKGKIVMTFISIFAFGMVMSIVAPPIIIIACKDVIMQVGETGDVNILLESMVIQHLALLNFIVNAIGNIAMLTAIYFRIKTLKH